MATNVEDGCNKNSVVSCNESVEFGVDLATENVCVISCPGVVEVQIMGL